MKKLFTILCVAVLTFSVSAQAQFGVTAGLNMSSVSGEDTEESDMKMGMHAGVSAAFELSDAMSLKTGALYSTKGAQDEENGMIYSVAFSYIEIPVNLSFSVSDQISLMAGPYVGLLMSAHSKISGGYLDEDEEVELNIKEEVANMDFGINIGASFSINESVSVGAGYQLGLADIGSEGDVDATNSNIHIGMTFSFGGGY